MNVNLLNSNSGVSAWRINLFQSGLMKSTAQKLERQAERDRQVAFFENQKQNLKNIECASPEEAGKILEMLHSYEDQIAAVKAAYNNAQAFHLMDEAKEQGERMAKAIEESEPKSAEERKQEAVEEALGIDDEKGMLSEILDEITEEILAEAMENISNEAMPKDAESVTNETISDDTESLSNETTPGDAKSFSSESILEDAESVPPASYKRFDALI